MLKKKDLKTAGIQENNNITEWLDMESGQDDTVKSDIVDQKQNGGKKKKNKIKYQKVNKTKTKKSKKQVIPVNVIPYTKVYPAHNLIQEGDFYSVAYRVSDADTEASVAITNEEMKQALLQLINGFSDKIALQFFSFNEKTGKDVFMQSVKVPVDDEFMEIKENYNSLLSTYADVGSNYVNKTRFFIVRTEKGDIESAAQCLTALDTKIKSYFNNISEISVKKMSVQERLNIMYNLYNPGMNQFGSRLNMSLDTLDFEAIKNAKKITTKHLVAPDLYKEEKTFIKLNDNTYVRTFFINNIPSYISDNLVSDLRDVSGSMAYSVIYEPLSSEYGYKTIAKRIEKNTVIDTRKDMSSIAAKKTGKVIKQEHTLKNNEQTYFEQSAAEIIGAAKDRGEKVFLTAIALALYAPDLETLERDSERLYSSASKYAFQIKCLDFQQMNGLKTILPLANTHIDAFRCLTSEKAACLLPLDLSDAIKKDGSFYGLNAINDNLIMLNRKNNYQVSGLITGVRHAGKTYSVKREVVNEMITGDDCVFVITNKSEYDRLIDEFDAAVWDEASYDIFTMPDEYGITGDKTALKAKFLSALFASNLYKNARYGNQEELLKAEEELQHEVNTLMVNLSKGVIFNPEEYPHIFASLTGDGKCPMSTAYIAGDADTTDVSKLNILNVTTTSDMAVAIDYVWNMQIELMRHDLHSWVFIDSVDEMLATNEGATYLAELIKLSNSLYNPLTLVVNNSAAFTNNNNIRGQKTLQSILSGCGYVKLLNEGPVERKFYSEYLNIPASMQHYISNVDIGCGLIITPSGCVPFDDYFHDEEDHFYEIFEE